MIRSSNDDWFIFLKFLKPKQKQRKLIFKISSSTDHVELCCISIIYKSNYNLVKLFVLLYIHVLTSELDIFYNVLHCFCTEFNAAVIRLQWPDLFLIQSDITFVSTSEFRMVKLGS